MDTTTSVVATVLITTFGQWSTKDGKVSIKLVVGMMALAVFLSMLDSANSELARKFAVLILVSAVFMYAVPISQKLGLIK